MNIRFKLVSRIFHYVETGATLIYEKNDSVVLILYLFYFILQDSPNITDINKTNLGRD
jgi:hypothetical protein